MQRLALRKHCSAWKHRRRLAALAMLVAILGAVFACQDNELGLEKRHSNQAPETLLSGSPPDSSYDASYRVRMRWTGSDADGAIDHFDFIVVDHPGWQDSIATHDPGSAHRVIVQVPAPDDPRWTSTSANESLFVMRADTPQDPRDAATLFQRWHTFFVRAVDNDGAVDRSPDYVSFNARTYAPNVYLKEPVWGHPREFSGPPTIVFNWDGEDPVGDSTTRRPVASRWIVLPSFRNTYGEYRGLDADSIRNASPQMWSAWRDWDARDGSGRSAVVRNLRSISEPGAGFYIFAVQAMDEAGAVSQVFDWTSPDLSYKRNTVPFYVTGDIGPGLTIQDQFHTTFRFAHASNPIAIDIAVGQTVQLCWSGDARAYGGHIVGYRYGWDLQDPENDEAWEQNWSRTALCAPPRAFLSGTHVFWLEALDNAEGRTRGRIEFTVRRLTRNRDLLFVDDTLHPQGHDDPSERAEDCRWYEVLDSLGAGAQFTWSRERDFYDVYDHNRLPPPLSVLFDYRIVVWSVGGSTATSGLSSLALFDDPFSDTNSNTARVSNYVNVYLDNGGKFWLCGDRPSWQVWPMPNGSRDDPLPANITNWKFSQTHPDSAGAGSFLHRMGIEGVDIGSGPLSVRGAELNQGCIGFRRSGPVDGGPRRFNSSVQAGHSHDLVIEGEHVESPPEQGITLATTVREGHFHTLYLGFEQLTTLGRGGTLVLETSINDIPSPHSHVFRLVDRVGLWGAPAELRTGITWPLPAIEVNPGAGRLYVEIYNIPEWMNGFSPGARLAPPPDRVLPLFLFKSLRPRRPDDVNWQVTADGQPALILTKRSASDPTYSRAYGGFEPWRLTRTSHLDLARYILLRQMGLASR